MQDYLWVKAPSIFNFHNVSQNVFQTVHYGVVKVAEKKRASLAGHCFRDPNVKMPSVCNPSASLGRGLCNGRLDKWRQCNEQWYYHQLLSERLLIAKSLGWGLCAMEPCGRLNNSAMSSGSIINYCR